MSLFEAIGRGDLEALAHCLDQGADPNDRGAAEETVLHWAARKGDLRGAALLLEHGADINARSLDCLPRTKGDVRARRRTALVEAAEAGHGRMVGYLLDQGADPNVPDERGQTALDVAVWRGDVDVVSILLEHGADVNHRSNVGFTALHRAAGNGRTDLLRMLLTAGAAIDTQADGGDTPLMRAASNRHRPAIEALVAAGANRDLENDAGKTAWHLALETGDPVALDLLQPTHVDPNRALVSRLMGVVAIKDVAAVQGLLAAGADPNLHRPGDTSPLIRAVQTGSAEIVGLLLEHQANVNARGPRESTALTQAAASYEERLDVVQVLLDHGADLNLPDDYGRTPLIHAVSRGHKAVAEALLAAGADVNLMARGASALHYAVGRNDRELVPLLIAHGADVNALDSDGETVLQNARKKGYREIVTLLKQAGASR